MVTKTYRALCEFRIEGVPTNIGFLQSLLQHPEFIANRVYTRFVEDNIAALVGGTNPAIGGCSSIARRRLPERTQSVPAGGARAQRSTRAIRWPCSITANRRAMRRRRLPRLPPS